MWEKHTKGVGSKILRKFGFNGRLGAKEDGISQIIEVDHRPFRLGLGYGNERRRERWFNGRIPLSHSFGEVGEDNVDIDTLNEMSSRQSKRYVSSDTEDDEDEDEMDLTAPAASYQLTHVKTPTFQPYQLTVPKLHRSAKKSIPCYYYRDRKTSNIDTVDLSIEEDCQIQNQTQLQEKSIESSAVMHDHNLHISDIQIPLKTVAVSHFDDKMDMDSNESDEYPDDDDDYDFGMIIKCSNPNEKTHMFYACFNSLRTLKHRKAFTFEEFRHPSEAYVFYLSHIQHVIDGEGYTIQDMRVWLINLKDMCRCKAFVWTQLKCVWSLATFLYSGSKKPQTLILFGVRLTPDTKVDAMRRMKAVKEEYARNRVNYLNQKKELYELQHNEFLEFQDYFSSKVPKEDRIPHCVALQRDNKGNSYYYDPAEDYVINNPTLEDVYYRITCLENDKVMRFEIVCDGEEVTFLVTERVRECNQIDYYSYFK
jgi:hypothetical protein